MDVHSVNRPPWQEKGITPPTPNPLTKEKGSRRAIRSRGNHCSLTRSTFALRSCLCINNNDGSVWCRARRALVQASWARRIVLQRKRNTGRFSCMRFLSKCASSHSRYKSRCEGVRRCCDALKTPEMASGGPSVYPGGVGSAPERCQSSNPQERTTCCVVFCRPTCGKSYGDWRRGMSTPTPG